MKTDNNETWRAVKGYEGMYEVSNMGRVRTLHTNDSYPRDREGRVLCAQLDNRGRYSVALCKNGKCKRMQVHRLVAMAFLPNPNNYPVVNHKDENPQNNTVENLEWCTTKYNLHYSNVPKKMKAAAVKKQQKAVLMYDKKGNFIREFESATKAAEYVGDFQQNVSKNCYGQTKSVKGYSFKFKNQ